MRRTTPGPRRPRAPEGRTLQYAAEGEILARIPSGNGRGLVDRTLEAWTPRPSNAAHEVWALWRAGRPAQRLLWAAYSPQGRTCWLGTALINHTRTRRAPGAPPSPGATYYLDGRHITDESGSYCG